MYDKLVKGAFSYGKKYIKRKLVREGIEQPARASSKQVDDFAKDWLDIGNANPVDEDEYMRRREELYNKRKKIPPQPPKPDISKLMPMQRDVSTWSSEDLNNIMNSREYQFDKFTQNKVKKYFDHKYPGPQKLDATGRPY